MITTQMRFLLGKEPSVVFVNSTTELKCSKSADISTLKSISTFIQSIPKVLSSNIQMSLGMATSLVPFDVHSPHRVH